MEGSKKACLFPVRNNSGTFSGLFGLYPVGWKTWSHVVTSMRLGKCLLFWVTSAQLKMEDSVTRKKRRMDNQEILRVSVTHCLSFIKGKASRPPVGMVLDYRLSLCFTGRESLCSFIVSLQVLSKSPLFCPPSSRPWPQGTAVGPDHSVGLISGKLWSHWNKKSYCVLSSEPLWLSPPFIVLELSYNCVSCWKLIIMQITFPIEMQISCV